MEEDIKLLEEVIEKYKTNTANILDLDSNDLFKRLILNQEQVQLLENLIKGYREKEESEKYLYDAYQDAGKKMFEYAEQLEDSVPKSKIKEKIEELEKQKEETYIKFLESDRNNERLSTKGKMLEGGIQVLQELLGDE